VLILSWEYPPIVEGGLARHVRKLSEALVAGGVRVDVVTRGGGRLSETEDRHGVAVHRVREPDFPKDDLDAFIAWVEHMNADMLAAALELDGPFDLVHSHDWLVADAARSLAGRFGVPPARVTAIPNGIDPTDLQPMEDLPRLRAQFAAPDDKLVLLVGRLVYEKGFHLALDAMPGLIERVGGVRFLVAGSGTAEAELKAQAQELGLMEHGSFVGWTGDDLLHSLYRMADLCVVPSLYEPFGLVALEAMASGCPCIVAATGGLREVVPGGGRVGLRFRARDPRSLARNGRAAALRRRAARPARGRGGGVGAALRLGRRRAADRRGLRRPARRARLVGRDDLAGRDRRARYHGGVQPDPRAVAQPHRGGAVCERRLGVGDHRPIADLAAGADVDPCVGDEHRAHADPRTRADPHRAAVGLDPAALAEPAAVLEHDARAGGDVDPHAALDVRVAVHVDAASEL
jgi:glycogen synthase